jgi:DNA replication protein DnaC
MNSENEAPELAETVCECCGQKVFYEPIYVGKSDLARRLHRYCEGCAARTAADERQRLQAARAAELLARVRRTLPPELLPKELDALGTDTEHPEFHAAMWKVVRKWRPGPHGNWIGLIGPAGECKTRCLGLLAANLIMTGHRVLWSSAMRLHADASVGVRSRDKNVQRLAEEHLSECLTAGWLILDDLGNNEWSPAFESRLFMILDYRKNHRLPLAYSSNTHPHGFHACITSVNAAALIGRLVDRADLFDFSREGL